MTLFSRDFESPEDEDEEENEVILKSPKENQVPDSPEKPQPQLVTGDLARACIVM